ncbi:ribosomal RNA large subunit methyltransferase J [endosymbiont of Acanthamoeba sp. UWC8]|uniref:RlmE family RNA methyltransferase n=1 Tax=endosymbiont of Acanthamoeba sp. UWC8 TaxID=86106 RepID=UPI0004D1349C|nr:RlmE family RNA methyltransferase [endosymbiont of Acanthamoeba sp. UWC8]AIF81300.1 ribosomal RNA large subunit methyltransferase J [endosymbiont of Acanthamoeba sp. UWC8]
MKDKSFRNTKQKLKTAKGRKIGSINWLQRHINDPYVNLCKKKGYRSRAAFKLLEIDEKFKILNNVKCIIDLGAAPGGWLQIAKEKANKAKIIGIDLKEIKPVEGVLLIEGDFLELIDNNEFQGALPDKVDVVLSDMAANACGDRQIDHLRLVELVGFALEFAFKKLNKGGCFVAKLLKGKEEKFLLDEAKKHFQTVKYFKPDASYDDSSEVYLIALKFKNQQTENL